MYSFFLMARRAGVPKSRCLSRLDYGSQRLRGGRQLFYDAMTHQRLMSPVQALSVLSGNACYARHLVAARCNPFPVGRSDDGSQSLWIPWPRLGIAPR